MGLRWVEVPLTGLVERRALSIFWVPQPPSWSGLDPPAEEYCAPVLCVPWFCWMSTDSLLSWESWGTEIFWISILVNGRKKVRNKCFTLFAMLNAESFWYSLKSIWFSVPLSWFTLVTTIHNNEKYNHRFFLTIFFKRSVLYMLIV